jgi:hypothetical protein
VGERGRRGEEETKRRRDEEMKGWRDRRTVRRESPLGRGWGWVDPGRRDEETKRRRDERIEGQKDCPKGIPSWEGLGVGKLKYINKI